MCACINFPGYTEANLGVCQPYVFIFSGQMLYHALWQLQAYEPSFFLSEQNSLGLENSCRDKKMSWQSRSRGMTKVTHMKFLQRTNSGEPPVVSGCFSTWPTCMCRIWNKAKRLCANICKTSLHLFLPVHVRTNTMSLSNFVRLRLLHRHTHTHMCAHTHTHTETVTHTDTHTHTHARTHTHLLMITSKQTLL